MDFEVTAYKASEVFGSMFFEYHHDTLGFIPDVIRAVDLQDTNITYQSKVADVLETNYLQGWKMSWATLHVFKTENSVYVSEEVQKWISDVGEKIAAGKITFKPETEVVDDEKDSG